MSATDNAPLGGLDHQRFLAALAHHVRAQVLIDAELRQACAPGLRALLPDGVARALGAAFGEPLVRWFPAVEPAVGARVADGVVLFDGASAAPRQVHFLADCAAQCAAELPADWRSRARVVGELTGAGLVATAGESSWM